VAVLIIDNYDSFTYNIVHYAESIVDEVVVWRNDDIRMDEVVQFDKIILSPGPHLPKDAGQMMELIEKYHDTIPILGICLGFQALGVFYGGKLINQKEVKHGRKEMCTLIKESVIFQYLPNDFEIGLYHSWALEEPLPEILTVTAKSEKNIIMAFEHKKFPIFGLQFHPESILTPQGKIILANFLETIF
jgi:anthranilate synthase component II